MLCQNVTGNSQPMAVLMLSGNNPEGTHPMHHDNPAMDACIQACLDCHRSCLATVAHCLTKGGSHAESRHIQIMLDCAQICAVCADFMIRGSAHSGHLCRECAEICGKCATSCADHADADEMMRACAEECRNCAAECEKTAA
jgi:hypothetical protein